MAKPADFYKVPQSEIRKPNVQNRRRVGPARMGFGLEARIKAFGRISRKPDVMDFGILVKSLSESGRGPPGLPWRAASCRPEKSSAITYDTNDTGSSWFHDFFRRAGSPALRQPRWL